MKKSTSLLVSEIFFNCLEQALPDRELGYLKTFNNCREQGYCLINYDKNWIIWACENRNSDEIMLVFGTSGDRDLHNMFNEECWKDRKYFGYQRYDLAVQAAIKFIKDMEEE